MPSKREKLLSPLQRIFSRSPSPNSIADRTELSTPPKIPPTIEEAKAAQTHPRACERLLTVCRGFTSLVKFIEPCLDGTPFKAPASVFVAVAKAVQTTKDTNESADAALDGLSARLRDVSKYFAGSKDDESELMLDEYAKELVRGAQEINELLSPSRLQALNVEGNKSKLEGIVGRIDKRTNNFHLRILLAIERDTKDIRDRLFISDLRSWNRAPSAQYKADAVENQPKRQACTEGTRVDVLRRIAQWAADPSSPSIFWLSGMAGSGKSTIAYTICQLFSKNDTLDTALGASFFCSRQVAELRRLGNIVPTLAYQLAHYSRSFATALDHANPNIVHVFDEQVEKLLLEPWKSSESDRSAELPSTLIVIDALDEIEEDKGAELLQKIIQATRKLKLSQKDTRQLKIFVTSRAHPHIVSASGLLESDAVYRLESIDKDQEREDILKFLTEKLRDLTPEHAHLLERLADRADGLFIYAATVTRILSSVLPSSGMTKKEKRVWLSRFVDSPKASASSELGAVYDLYKRVLYEAIPEHLRPHRLPILHRIVCTLQPLSVSGLARMLDVDSDDDVDQEAPVMLVEALHAVIYVSGSDGCVYIYHKSFSDYILNDQLSGRDLACDIDAQNAGISRACLRIMQTSLRFNICNLPSSYLLDIDVPNLTESIKINILNVVGLEYACRYWTSHLVKVSYSDANTQILCQQLQHFTNEKVLFWLEVINLLKITTNGYDGIKAVATWVNGQRDAPVKLKIMLAVALRLANSFFWAAASTSTPHLYISCLATEVALHSDFPTVWKNRFPRVPQFYCTRVNSQGGLLTCIKTPYLISSVAFSPDGAYVVSGCYDNAVRIWDASTGAEAYMFSGHADIVYSAAFSPNGARVISGSRDHSIRIWDVSTGTEVHKLDSHTNWVKSVAYSPDGMFIVSGSRDHSVRIWDAYTGVEMRKLDGHADGVEAVAYSPDGTRVVSGSVDQSVRIWDTGSGAEVQKFDGHAGGVKAVAYSPDGMRVVAGSGADSEPVRIWDVATGAEAHKLDGHTSWVSSVAFSPDGTRVVSGSREHSARIWDASTGAEVHRFDSLTNWVLSVAFSPNGTRVVSASIGQTQRVCIWDATVGADVQKTGDHALSVEVECVAFSPDGTLVASGSVDNSVRIWDALTGAEVRELIGHKHPVKSISFSPDGAHIASGAYDCTVRIWDASSGAEVHKLRGHKNGVDCVTFSSDGTRVASGSRDRSVRIWDVSTGTEVHRLGGHATSVSTVAFSPDGTRVVSGTDSGCAYIWDGLTGVRMYSPDETGLVTCTAFTPDRVRDTSCFGLQSAHIWDASTGAEMYEHKHDDLSSALSIALSPDCTRLVLNGDRHSVRVSDTLAGTEVLQFEGHAATVTCVAFSPDGTRVASSSRDGSVRIWDLSAGAEVGSGQMRLDHSTGWIATASSNDRLVWVPAYLRTGVHDGRVCTLVISRKGRTRIDVDGTCVGPAWADCYQPL